MKYRTLENNQLYGSWCVVLLCVSLIQVEVQLEVTKPSLVKVLVIFGWIKFAAKAMRENCSAVRQMPLPQKTALTKKMLVYSVPPVSPSLCSIHGLD